MCWIFDPIKCAKTHRASSPMSETSWERHFYWFVVGVGLICVWSKKRRGIKLSAVAQFGSPILLRIPHKGPPWISLLWNLKSCRLPSGPTDFSSCPASRESGRPSRTLWPEAPSLASAAPPQQVCDIACRSFIYPDFWKDDRSQNIECLQSPLKN